MRRTDWAIGSNGRYQIDVALGSLTLAVMVDTGLVDPRQRVGFEIDPNIYDRLLRAGELVLLRRRQRIDASGTSYVNEVGQTTAQSIDPAIGVPIGPNVRIDVMRGAFGVPNRVGTEFFHRLHNCRVVWDLDARLWSVEYP